jgi:hypothetical protein
MSELSPETEELLARGREGAPLSASRRDELKGAVLAKIALGAGAAGTSLTATSTSAAAWTMTTKTIGVAVIAAVIGTGTVGVVKYERHARAPQVATQSSQTNQTSNAANDSPASPIVMPSPTTSLPPETPQTFPVVQPTLDIAPTASTNLPQATNQNPTTTSNSVPAAERASASNAASTISNGSPNTPNSQAIVTSPDPHFSGSGSSSGQGASTAHASSLEEEATLLRAAQEALLANDPARALRLLDEHAARFPSSVLEPERSAERVFALCAEQKTDAAHVAAGTFLSAHPTGPLASRVRASCGGR